MTDPDLIDTDVTDADVTDPDVMDVTDAEVTATDSTDADFPDTDQAGAAAEPTRRLPEFMPDLSPGLRARIVAQVLELGCPVLEISRRDGLPAELG
ncbi:hypothetical protein [Streptomyces endophytica]|uniref:Uncharacterized protein n=1 Tax=Streptomyces endophytica TaxID=2991496 RepID=A0ABY6PLN5_9ACTN|nr:hypothetical protein [Streptomyces endophytica]UZJ34282.1 hypothetical protein OJ254_28030 [Streptomyces endophytica]